VIPAHAVKRGTIYESVEPGRLVRIHGQSPWGATVYELQKLRCHLCGEIFTASAPPSVGQDKYDAASASMIALLKYGSGLPFNRLERLQGSLGIPLPAATQWEIVRHAGENLAAVLQQRASALGRPIQMCDALSRNVPKAFETILGHCLTHGRRQFVDVATHFPDECLYVLQILKDVYRNDAVARDQQMSPEEHLVFHQAQS